MWWNGARAPDAPTLRNSPAPTGTTYSDTGLSAGASYSYEVEAIDIAGNVSPFSNIATAIHRLHRAHSITYVQGNYATPQTDQTTVTVTFTAAQAAGDLNVVVVGWNDTTATVKTRHRQERQHLHACGRPNHLQWIRHAIHLLCQEHCGSRRRSEHSNRNLLCCRRIPDLRIVEYSGADPTNPVDVTAAGTGTSATSSSGSVTTT